MKFYILFFFFVETRIEKITIDNFLIVFYYFEIKFSDEHPKETEELWATLCGCWPNNLKVIIRYLIIVSGMAPQELLPYVSTIYFILLFFSYLRYNANVIHAYENLYKVRL